MLRRTMSHLTQYVTFDAQCHFSAPKCHFLTQNVTSLTQNVTALKMYYVLLLTHYVTPKTKYDAKCHFLSSEEIFGEKKYG